MRLKLLIIVFVCLLTAQAVLAKEIVQVTITTPSGEQRVVDLDSNPIFGEIQFGAMVQRPDAADTSPMYEIRLAVGHEGTIVATNVYHYYPEIGYIYYADVENGFASIEKQWFVVEGTTHHQMQAYLNSANTRVHWPQRILVWFSTFLADAL